MKALALKYFRKEEEKLKHKKIKKLNHESLEMSENPEPNSQRKKLNDAQLLFQLRTKMVQVKANYSSKYREDLNCILCEKEGRFKKDTQKHIMKCPTIRKEIIEQEAVHYEDLNSDILNEQIDMVKRFRKMFEVRKKLIETVNNSHRS